MIRCVRLDHHDFSVASSTGRSSSVSPSIPGPALSTVAEAEIPRVRRCSRSMGACPSSSLASDFSSLPGVVSDVACRSMVMVWGANVPSGTASGGCPSTSTMMSSTRLTTSLSNRRSTGFLASIPLTRPHTWPSSPGITAGVECTWRSATEYGLSSPVPNGN